ncbi:MAG: formimidoylglutamate deiminase [Pseudomonadota bacterium]|nr:formimidoylglutamate deiminase [Pseudomonadota bacterium]
MSFLLPDLLYSGCALHPALAVQIAGDRVGRVVPAAQLPAGAVVERLPGRALLPGFVNAHSHAFQRGLRGHVQYASGPGPTSAPGPSGGGSSRPAFADSFWTWRDRMYRLANALDPDGVEAVSALAFLEMARAGFTTVGEFHYLHHAPDGARYADPDELALRVVAAAETVGIRIVLLRVAYARAGAGLDPNPLQRRFYDRGPDDVLAALARLRARGVAVGLAPHSVRACPADWLTALAAFDGPVHAHVDEQPAEIAASLHEHGRRPLQVFADAGLLGPRFTAVHLTHPDDDELALLRAAGGRVCVCPTTELDLGDGLFPLDRAAGIELCIGSDSHALIDPFTELRSIEWHARAATGRRNVMGPFEHPDGSANALLHAGTRGGALALGVDAGTLAPGTLADLVAVDIADVALRGARLLPALVFSGHPGLVTDVWVGGRRIVAGRHHLGSEAIVGAAERALEKAGG